MDPVWQGQERQGCTNCASLFLDPKQNKALLGRAKAPAFKAQVTYRTTRSSLRHAADRGLHPEPLRPTYPWRRWTEGLESPQTDPWPSARRPWKRAGCCRNGSRSRAMRYRWPAKNSSFPGRPGSEPLPKAPKKGRFCAQNRPSWPEFAHGFRRMDRFWAGGWPSPWQLERRAAGR